MTQGFEDDGERSPSQLITYARTNTRPVARVSRAHALELANFTCGRASKVFIPRT
jgi:hypothetical protein